MVEKEKNKKMVVENKKKTFIILIILFLFFILFGVGYYVLKIGKTEIEKSIPETKEKILSDYLSGATTGKDSDGGDITIEERMNLYEKSADALSLYIESNQSDIDAIMKLAGVYYNLGDLDNAEIYFKKALALDSNIPILNNNLANILRDKGKYAEAEKYYKKSIELDPQNPTPYFNFAVMLYTLEDKKDEAIKIIKEGLENSPESEILNRINEEYSI